MEAITTWFFTGGGFGGDVRLEGEYRCLTGLSLKSPTYHMKLFIKFITTIRLLS